jgi:hypothetical protein
MSSGISEPVATCDGMLIEIENVDFEACATPSGNQAPTMQITTTVI